MIIKKQNMQKCECKNILGETEDCIFRYKNKGALQQMTSKVLRLHLGLQQ